MAAKRKSGARKRTTKRAPARKSSSSSRRGGGSSAVDRASASLDASQKAFRDLRDELQKGGSKLIRDADLRDLEKTVKSAGTSFRRLSKRLLKDLEDVQKAATGGKRPAQRKSSGTKKRKSTAKRKSSSTTKRAASSAKKAAKRTSGAAKGAKTGAKRGAGGAKKRSGAKKR